ncbi:uracil-DNA glycosylase [Tenuibacillus multivorans]|uniref:Uracil-DNA glycosylase n=1 Tax=Tenuibacillus multivorans TaxID=237069 RepID=A0A1H0CPX4_9BACI|nr:uracil-DNA glycosylase [Tenuibacillus multivorans]GEL76210.1 uracil-DNA glycosylase [Tenuibacillus multivorans]SDN59967.1 uracil-DNA glycosylase [Tenuibacillus multivorans]
MNIYTDWKYYLENELTKPYFIELHQFIEEQYKHKDVYPKKDHIFNALNTTPLNTTKVVIIGQDPYHGPNQANGLSFSVNPNIPLPPSLKNIYKELLDDIDCEHPTNGDLTHWAKQGVLLLNTVLTVEVGQPNSHRQKGWETFTDRVLTILNEEKEHLVFLMWGKQALKKGHMIDRDRHLILHAPHPSPLSAYRGFFGSKPFSKANTYLKEHNQSPIKWGW